jgi:hypothetical protein
MHDPFATIPARAGTPPEPMTVTDRSAAARSLSAAGVGVVLLPEAVAVAAFEFILRPLSANPRRVGRVLVGPSADRHAARRGTYRVIHGVDESTRKVTVLTSPTGSGFGQGRAPGRRQDCRGRLCIGRVRGRARTQRLPPVGRVSRAGFG